MFRSRTIARALLPFALHGLAREVDASVGVLLRTTLDVPGFVREAMGLLDPAAMLRSLALWTAAGAGLWLLLAVLRRRQEGGSFGAALEAEAGAFGPLYLRPALTLLGLASLALRPTFPYGFTLPVALTQDWAIAQDLAALAALVALLAPALRLPAPSAGGIFFVTFLAYALLTPERVRHWDGHPGNEPKYLRMGVSLGWAASLDVAEVSALPEESPPIETLQPRPFGPAAVAAARGVLQESARMLRALVQGPEAVGASAIRATRLARQTVEGKEGGVYHVLAPGPSVLLAPTLRVDRALNLRHGTPGRLAVTLLAWNAMGAALIAALFLLLRDVTGRPGIAAALAGGCALLPPFLFYFFQFYPEMPGALLVTLALRSLLFGRRWTGRTTLWLGLLLALLPWLHQKFLPVWGVLVLMAAVRAVDELVSFRALLALLVPQAVSLYLTALWNFAITGSVRPDALFLAWGPGGVTSARIDEGFLGLLLDARYGILPFVPLYLLAAGGFVVGASTARRLAWALPAVLSYHLTVAAADNWSGAVCNLGRYILPVVPLLVALVGAVLARIGGRRGVLTVTLALVAWSGLLAWQLWQDPRAANDNALLLAKSAFADGNVYIPNLFFRSPLYLAPGHVARTLAWLVLLLLIAFWLRRAATGRAGGSPTRALAGLAAVALVGAAVLERWPTGYTAPRFPNDLTVAPGVVAFASGPVVVEADHVRAWSGEVELLVRSRTPLLALEVIATGQGVVTLPGQAPVVIPSSGARLVLPLTPLRVLTGRRGAQETLARQRLSVETGSAVLLRVAAGEERD